MKPAGSKISYAKLHASIFIVNYGELGPTLTETADAKNRACKMEISDCGLFLMVDSAKGPIAVPMTNVTHMVIKPS